MTKSLGAAIDQIQSLVTTATSLSGPGYDITDDVQTVPFVVTDPGGGKLSVSSSTAYEATHTIRCRLLVPVDDYPRYRSALRGYVETIHTTLMAPANLQLSGAVDIVTSIDYSFLDNDRYGPYPVMGYSFDVGVAIHT